MGRSTALLTTGNTVVEVKRQAMATPIVEKVSAASAIAPIISIVSSGAQRRARERGEGQEDHALGERLQGAGD